MKLYCFVHCATTAQMPQYVQRQVLGTDRPFEPSRDHDTDCLRHAQPGTSAGEYQSYVGGSHSRSEGPDGTVGVGVRVGPYNDISGFHQPLFDHHLVADAPSDIEQ